MRNPNPFTDRQQRFLQAIIKRLRKISDPTPEIITRETYEFKIKKTVQFGAIPAIIFKPHSNQIKAEIIQDAGLLTPDRKQQLNKIRKKYGILEKKHKEARLFNSEWDNLMFAFKKDLLTSSLINRLFSTQHQSISEPASLMQQILIEEHKELSQRHNAIYDSQQANLIKNKGIKTYTEKLREVS